MIIIFYYDYYYYDDDDYYRHIIVIILLQRQVTTADAKVFKFPAAGVHNNIMALANKMIVKLKSPLTDTSE